MFIDELTRLAFGSLDGDPSARLQAATVDHLVDTVGALLVGRETLGARLERLAEGSGLGGPPGSPAGRRGIALVAGSAVHAWELDDLHHRATVCAGSVVLPALLGATAAAPELSWGRFLRAYRAGYDVAVVAGRSIAPSEQLARGWWPTSLVGPLGAAAALAVAAGDRARCTASLGIAAQQAGGSLAGTTAAADSRQLLAGVAAERGVWADLAAVAGWAGPGDFFDVARTPLPVGVTAAVPLDPPGTAIQDAGIKRFPAAQHLQAAVEILLDLLSGSGLAASEIERIDCALPAPIARIVDQPPRPPSALAALANGPFVLATAAIAGRLGTAEYGAGRRDAPEVLALASKVGIVADDSLGEAYPARWGARVEITARGTTFAEQRASAKGSRDRPMSSGDVDRKFLENVRPILGADRAGAVLAALREAPAGGRAAEVLPVEAFTHIGGAVPALA